MHKRTTGQRRRRAGKAENQSRGPAGAAGSGSPLDEQSQAILDEIRALLRGREVWHFKCFGEPSFSSAEMARDFARYKHRVKALKQQIAKIVNKYLLPRESHRRGRAPELLREWQINAMRQFGWSDVKIIETLKKCALTQRDGRVRAIGLRQAAAQMALMRARRSAEPRAVIPPEALARRT
jgi:hypothetical protein